MTTPKPQPASPPFQFSLRTLLLLFVVLGSSLAVFGGWGIAVFALTVGLAVYVHQAESLPSWAELLLVVPVSVVLVGMLLTAVEYPREAGRRTTCANNLHQIAVALQAYHQANGCFPPAYIADKYGKPMHSWRVLILPYLDQVDLYNAYDFSEPWDGPKNKGLLAKCPPIYRCPSGPPTSVDMPTNYVAVVGPNTAWAGEKPRKLADFGKDASNTIMLVETTDTGIGWTEPRDLPLDAVGSSNSTLAVPAVSSKHGQGMDFFFIYDRSFSVINVAMADGSVQGLSPGISTEELGKMLRVGGCGEEEREGAWSRTAVYDGQLRLNWPNIAALAVWLLSVGTLLTLAVRSRKVRPVLPP